MTALPSPDPLLPLPPAAFHILLSLAEGDRHGYAIIQDVAARTGGEVTLGAGTLYRTIQRMLEQDLIVEVDAQPVRQRRRAATLLPRDRRSGGAWPAPRPSVWPASSSWRARPD